MIHNKILCDNGTFRDIGDPITLLKGNMVSFSVSCRTYVLKGKIKSVDHTKSPKDVRIMALVSL